MLRLETKSVQVESSEKEVASLNQEIRELKLSFSAKEEELLRTVEEKNLYQQKVAEMEQEVDRIRRSLLSVQGRVGHGIIFIFFGVKRLRWVNLGHDTNCHLCKLMSLLKK